MHFIVDLGFISLITYGLVSSAFYNEPFAKLFKGLENIVGEQFGLWIFLVSLRIIYYIVFEYFFQATPAKFLTETRVTDESGNKPAFKQILIRTLCRFIPFEPFSYLFKKDWHDNISETYVINENRSGTSGWFYFIGISILLILTLIIFFLK